MDDTARGGADGPNGDERRSGGAPSRHDVIQLSHDTGALPPSSKKMNEEDEKTEKSDEGASRNEGVNTEPHAEGASGTMDGGQRAILEQSFVELADIYEAMSKNYADNAVLADRGSAKWREMLDLVQSKKYETLNIGGDSFSLTISFARVANPGSEGHDVDGECSQAASLQPEKRAKPDPLEPFLRAQADEYQRLSKEASVHAVITTKAAAKCRKTVDSIHEAG